MNNASWIEPLPSLAQAEHVQPTPSRRYRTGLWCAERGDRAVVDAWSRLIRTHDPITAVHQTPAYLAYLDQTGKSPEIIVVEERSPSKIAGIVPVRTSKLAISFDVKGRAFARRRVRSLLILGSEPMVGDDPQALEELFLFIGDRYPDVQVIDMYAVRQQGWCWKYLSQSEALARQFGIYVIGGFRDSYSVILPETVDEYYRKLAKKRRYNLRRQERLLEEQLGGGLELTPVCTEDHLPTLFAALAQVGVSAGPDAPFTAEQYRAACRNGILQCYVLSAGGRIVGVATGIKSDRTYFVHDLYFNRMLAKFSPGTTLWQVVLRHLIEEAVFTRVGISHGNPAYRFAEVNDIERKGHVLLYRRTTRNHLLFKAHAAHVSCLAAVKAGLRAARKLIPHVM